MKQKYSKISDNSELLDPLREIFKRQEENNFDLGGIPDSFIKMYKAKRWLSNHGALTLQGINKLQKLYECQ